MNDYSIKLSKCECISQDDKEMLMNMVEDAISKRRESYGSFDRKPAGRATDISLIKSYERFIELVQHFKTC